MVDLYLQRMQVSECQFGDPSLIYTYGNIKKFYHIKMKPIYYVHAAVQPPDSQYRITATTALALLGYGRNGRTDEQIAQDILEDTPPQLLANDSELWRSTHKTDARNAHQLFRPTSQRLNVGLCLNGIHPWLADTPDEFIWTPDGPGQTIYHAPFSKQLPQGPSSIQEIRIAFTMAVTGWTRPLVD